MGPNPIGPRGSCWSHQILRFGLGVRSVKLQLEISWIDGLPRYKKNIHNTGYSWWLSHPSEKYDRQNGFIWNNFQVENKTCLTPTNQTHTELTIKLHNQLHSWHFLSSASASWTAGMPESSWAGWGCWPKIQQQLNNTPHITLNRVRKLHWIVCVGVVPIYLIQVLSSWKPWKRSSVHQPTGVLSIAFCLFIISFAVFARFFCQIQGMFFPSDSEIKGGKVELNPRNFRRKIPGFIKIC